jgi:hypothetical protein
LCSRYVGLGDNQYTYFFLPHHAMDSMPFVARLRE